MLYPTVIIGMVVAITIAAAFAKHRDTFHPALLMGPMLAFHYCYSPLVLDANDGFRGYLWDTHVARAQWIHLTGVVALCGGLLAASPRSQRATQVFGEIFDSTVLVRGSFVLAAAGIASFVYGILNVGGFASAYGRSYGGGYAESGWVRDLALLCLPALLLFTISRRGRFSGLRDWLVVLAFASPFLIHGLLGARRGPTFMGFAGPAMVFYMARAKRPRLLTLVVAAAILGILMLTLVSNRRNVYWGSNLELREDPANYFRTGAGNDFIYGSGLVIVTDETQDFGWGATYLTTLFVRPIPKAIWPTKYQDAAQFFGKPMLDENLGVDVQSFNSVLGWTAAIGAAPGIVGDMWREFSWGMLIALLGLGWMYAHAWRSAIEKGGAWVAVYCFMASLSLYLVMQTLEAMLYRFIFGLIPMLLVLRHAKRVALAAPSAPQPLVEDLAP